MMVNKLVRVEAVIILPGDRSVGIPDGSIKLDFGEYVGSVESAYTQVFECYVGGREEHRQGLQEWADRFHENCGRSRVVYGDECEDCGCLKTDHRAGCPNQID